MYNLDSIDVINFLCKFAVISHHYKKDSKPYVQHHVLHLIEFLCEKFVSEPNDKNDGETLNLLSNLHTWLKNIKSWENKPKITLKLPDVITKNKWSNVELNVFSEHMSASIKNTGVFFFKRKEIDNPLGIIEWLITMLLQKYSDPQLKQLLQTFIRDVSIA